LAQSCVLELARNKNEWKLKQKQSHFTNIFVFYAGDPMKRLKPASASTFTIIRGGNVLRAKTNLPLVNQSLSPCWLYKLQGFPPTYILAVYALYDLSSDGGFYDITA